MSISASLDIILQTSNNEEAHAFDIINILSGAGWSFINNAYISYLPLHDNDEFNWKTEKNIAAKELEKLLISKEKANELVGILMTWANTEIGGDFLFWPKEVSNKTFSVNLNAFRPMVKLNSNYEIIDFQWYLEKLLPPLEEAFGVESFLFEQQR
jgi:hypothetical protein